MNAALGLLEVAGLIREEGGDAQREFAFRHTLLRDTAYHSLLLEERKALHRQVGLVLERIHPKAEAELASVLAHHFLMADLKGQAFVYLCRAADEAARVYALEEALEHYGSALELALAGHGSDEDIDYLFERKGRMLELAGRYQPAVETYLAMEEAGRLGSKPAREARALLRRANLYSIPSAIMDREQGRTLSEKALAMAQDLGDRAMESLAHWNLMKVSEFSLDYKPARTHGEQALALLEGLDETEQRAFILNDLAAIYMSTGDLGRAMQVSQQAKSLWTQLDNLPMLVDATCNEMTLHLLQGRYEVAQRLSQESSELSESINNDWGKSYSRYMVYWTYAEQGDFARALTIARECIAFAKEAGFLVPQFQTLSDVGLLHASLGEFERAYAALDQASTNAEQFFEVWAAYPQAIKALVLTWQDRYDEAEGAIARVLEAGLPISRDEFSFVGFLLSLVYPGYWLGRKDWGRALAEADRFIDIFDPAQMEFLMPDLHLYRGLALHGLDRNHEARTALETGLERAERLGSKRSSWPLHDALAALALELGDEGEARRQIQRGKEVIDFISNHTENEEQRQSFLAFAARTSRALKLD